jgi:hypothetical protein
MRKSSWLSAALLLGTLFIALLSQAQVVAPVEIKDPGLRALQTQYMDDLKAAGAEINSIPFEYPFYLSRKLDLDEQAQKSADQRSMRFDTYEGKTVIAITGNYYAAYSAQHLSKEQRARATFLNVAVPILKATVPKFQANKDVKGYALEISHHILGKVMGVSMERPENLLIYLPQPAAMRLLNAKDEEGEQAATLQGQFFVNAEPVSIWLGGGGQQVAGMAEAAPDSPSPGEAAAVSGEGARGTDGHSITGMLAPSFPKRAKPVDESQPAAAPRDTSPEAIAHVDATNKDTVAKITKELDSQAHFVPYAQPAFIVFRSGLYLQFSLNTTLNEGAGGSRYKLAADAFDEDVSHLIRPMLSYFKEDPNQELKFDGISFSTTVRLPGKNQPGTSGEAVEFFFPFAALRCYEKFDCTGQQLLDAGSVLINGERVGLDLQVAEGGRR